MKATLFALLLLLVYWTGVSAGLTVQIFPAYTPPPDFNGGPNDYRAASSVTLTCQVSAGMIRGWSSTCTSNCFVQAQTTETITRTVLRSTDSGNHTCTATRDVKSATIEMNVVGAGIYVNFGDPTGVLPNNGIVIALDVISGDRIRVQCRSGSLDTGVGQLVDLNGDTFNIGQTSGVFSVENTGSGSHPGSVQFRNRAGAETLTAADEGVYTCRIPDETGNVVDVNIGVYRNGFNTPPTVFSLTYDCGTRTLTCTSTGSPATTVTWTKDGDTLTVDGTTYSMTQTVTDRGSSTYENVLTLPATGDITGMYGCLVENALGNSDQRTVNLRTPGPLQVEITPNGGDTVAGEQYTLTCTVTVPDGLTGTLTVVWTGDDGMTGVTEGTAETSGRVTTLTLTFNPLRDSQDGGYTCMATFSCRDVTDKTASAVQNLDVVAPEVTVTVSATGGAPIVGGTSYFLTCVHDAPQSLMATVQNTLTSPGGTMITSLPHTFNPLRVTDGGQYSCTAIVSSPYLTGDFTATQGTPLNVVVEIPSLGVEASANPTGTIIAGSVLTLTCTITLDGGLSGMLNDLSVTTVWRTEGGQEVSTGGNIMVSGAAFAVGTTYSSTLSFITVYTGDAGDYTCTATVSPSFPSNTVMNGVDSSDPPVTVLVNVPTITVHLEPNTTRLPTEPPYNTFTITCTATVPEGVVAGKTIEWKRRIGSSSTGLSEITDNGDTIQIVTTNLNQPETISVLTVTETTPGDYRYRCRVDIPELDSVSQMTEDVYPIDVIGPTPPVEPTNLMDIATSFNSATIQWTVPLIAFTPETYVVHYGTNMGSLDLMSDPVESGDDFEAVNTIFTVQLKGLNPGTMYYYQVNATNSNASTLSDIELFQTDAKPPSAPPQNFIINSISSDPTRLQFSWEPPPASERNGDIIAYPLSCDPDPFGGVPQVSSSTNVILGGFKPATTYECRVSAGTSAGYGPDVAIIVTTPESIPSSPPQNVRLMAESSSTVLVTWVEPAVPNGVIILYTVYVIGSMGGTTEGTVTMYTITDLLPYQLVTVSVSAHTAVGEGPESNATSVRSKEAAPGKVSNLVVVGLDSTTLYVSWDKPVALNGILKNYTIFVNDMDSGENIAAKEVDVSTQNLTIKDHLFGPGIPYNVSVAAVNSAGRGEIESVIAFTEEETPSAPRGIAVIWLNNTHMNVSWELLTPIQARGHVTNYTVSYQPTGSIELETKVVHGDQNSVVIGGLDPYEAYSVQVWANTAAGGGNTSETLTIEAVLSQKEMIFQLQLTGIHNCREWVSFNADAKVSDIHTAMQHDIEHLCMCGFTTQHLSESELQCFMNLEEVTFRALIIGTTQATSSELIEYIEQWIAGGASILVQTVRLTIDDTCHPVEINTFNDPECGTESPTQAAQPDNTGAIVAGVVVATVLIIAIISVTVVMIVILILKNRRANISLQRKGEPVKWSEVAKSGEITIAGCAAYGAVHQQPESHDYEFPENYAVISQTDNPPAEAVYEPIPGDSQ